MNKYAAFTLMEMMIILAIIGILASIAIPSYRVYTRRAHYVEVVQAVGPYKLGVEECYQVTGTLSDCLAGDNGVPLAINDGEGAGMIGSIQVSQNGVIKITPQVKYGIEAKDDYVLTPVEDRGRLVWQTSGGAVAAGYAN